ncbi:MAG TPA: sigma-70 family RNA polymerase sigma factor, partial [Thermoleophilaceae bacterium]|nr:sigma-70 family RNA polymerase sigma factor [Thermoleophilaceae bacterium]
MPSAAVISMSSGRGAGPAIGMLGDRRLARLAAKGDPRAFAAIYERYHQDLFRYCRSITGNAEDASDALQSTMTAALRALPGEGREIALRPWLFRIAHNEAVSVIRRRPPSVELSEDDGPTSPGPHSIACLNERLTGLVADLGALPERQRGALVMREVSGLDYDEIGCALNMSPSAARQAVYEARLALSESELGREMACDAARRSISARDGRVLRGRRLRAHLRGCGACTAFSHQLGARRSALPALLPPLPAAAGTAILGGLVGGAASVGAGASIGAVSGAGSGGVMSLLAGGLSQAAGASAAAKGAAAAVAVAVVAGVGTVEVAEEVDKSPSRSQPSVARGGPSTRAASMPGKLAQARPTNLRGTHTSPAGRPSTPGTHAEESQGARPEAGSGGPDRAG